MQAEKNMTIESAPAAPGPDDQQIEEAVAQARNSVESYTSAPPGLGSPSAMAGMARIRFEKLATTELGDGAYDYA